MNRVFLSLAAAASALSACAAVPHLGPEPKVKPASSYATAQSFQAPPAAWPEAAWWTRYQDPQLNGLVDEALKDSPSLVQAAARLRRAQALAEEARAAVRPNLSASGQIADWKQSYTSLGIPPAFVPHGFHGYTEALLNLNWDLDLWGRNRASLAAATSEAEATRMDAAQTRLMLTTGVIAAYADLAEQFRERDAAVQALANRRATADLVAQRVRDGVANQGEAHQAQSDAAAAAQDLTAIDEQIGLTRNRIAALVGAGPDRGLAIARPTANPASAFGLPQNAALDLVGRRPDVQAARLRVEAAARRIKVARAGFYPNISIAGLAGRQALDLSNMVLGASNTARVGLATSLPIFSGGQLEGAYRGARADYDAAVGAYDQALVQALQEVADAATSERELQTRLADARQALAEAEEASRIAHLRYQAGLTNFLYVLTAEDQAIAQRRNVAQLEGRALSLDAALARALGGGFSAS